MKKLTDFGKLILIWLISILVFNFSFSVFAATIRNSNDDITVIFMFTLTFIFTLFFAALSSIPNLIFFVLLGMVILQTKYSQRTKKIFLMIINTLGILVLCIVTFGFISLIREKEGLLYPLNKYIWWYPNWVLLVSSNLAILLMPFGNKKTSQTNSSSYGNT